MDKKYLWVLDTIWEDSEVVNCTTKIYLKRECKDGTYEVTTDVMQAAKLTSAKMKEVTGDDWQLFADHEIYDPGVTGSVGNVGHPDHYKQHGRETIDTIRGTMSREAFHGYCIGNVVKYIGRFKFKNGVEDLEKARWYLDTLIADEKEGGHDED